MASNKTYYCSSPALDWRLSGIDTSDGYLEPDPLIYPTTESLQKLLEETDLEKGLGIPPPGPVILPKLTRKMNTLREDTFPIVKQEGGYLSPLAPQTPPSSQSKCRVESQNSPINAASSATSGSAPSKVPMYLRNSTPTSPSPLGKRARVASETEGSPTKRKGRLSAGAGNKWAIWEDQLIKVNIVNHGEKGVDWHAILKEMNKRRVEEGEVDRTLNALKLHWTKSLKLKMLE